MVTKFQSSSSKDAIKLYGGNLEAFTSKEKIVILVGAAGTGKCQPNNTSIPTPNGLVKLGDLKIDDYVFSYNGKKSKVIGVFPQGNKISYRILFSDGTSTECCEDHQWLLYFRDSNNKITFQIIETKELIKNNNIQYFVPYSKPVEYDEKDLLIDPYLMGRILVKQEIYNSSKSIKNKSDITKKDFYQYIDKNIEEVSLNYLQNSIENRIKFLQGILDIGANINNNNDIVFSSFNIELIKVIKHLVLSLGGTIHNSINRQINIKGKQKYKLIIYLPDYIEPFLSQTKSCKIKGKRFLPEKKVISIVQVGLKPMTCIAVDDESSLYLTNDFIVTHNTFSLCLKMHLFCIKYPGVKVLLCRKTLPALRNTVVKTYQGILELTKYSDKVRTYGESRPTSFIYDYSEQEYEDGKIYKGTSEIILSNIDLQGTALGAEYDMIYVNQPDTGGLTEDEFTIVASRCRAQNGPYRQILADPNPASEQHWLLQGSLGINPKWNLIYSHHIDNPAYYDHELGEWTMLGQEHLRQLELLPDHLKQSQLQGKWYSMEGNVFGSSWNPGKHVLQFESTKAVELGISKIINETEEGDYEGGEPIYERSSAPEGWHSYLAIDWGGVDPFIALLCSQNPVTNQYIIHRHIYIPNIDIIEFSELVAQMIQPYNIKDIITDRGTSDQKVLERITGLPVHTAKKGNNSVESSINIMIAELNSDRWLFLDTEHSLFNLPDEELLKKNKPMGLEEIPNLKRDEKGGIAPRQSDHYTDALRYLMRYLVELRGGASKKVPFYWL